MNEGLFFCLYSPSQVYHFLAVAQQFIQIINNNINYLRISSLFNLQEFQLETVVTILMNKYNILLFMSFHN